MTETDMGTAVVACARCGDGWTATQDQPFFDDWDEAMPYALAVGWHLTGDGLLCPDCSLRASCERAGHRWGNWTALSAVPSMGLPGGSVRFCRVCTAGQYDSPVVTEPRPLCA